jgi:hypothetical protein
MSVEEARVFPLEPIFWYWIDQWWELCERQRQALDSLRASQPEAPAPPFRYNARKRPPRLVVDNTRR